MARVKTARYGRRREIGPTKRPNFRTVCYYRLGWHTGVHVKMAMELAGRAFSALREPVQFCIHFAVFCAARPDRKTEIPLTKPAKQCRLSVCECCYNITRMKTSRKAAQQESSLYDLLCCCGFTLRPHQYVFVWSNTWDSSGPPRQLVKNVRGHRSKSKQQTTIIIRSMDTL